MVTKFSFRVFSPSCLPIVRRHLSFLTEVERNDDSDFDRLFRLLRLKRTRSVVEVVIESVAPALCEGIRIRLVVTLAQIIL